MELSAWIIQNKDIIKILYGLVIAFICTIIVVKTDKLFRLSLHNGIRYFRNAFLFYGIGFLVRFIFGSSFFYDLFYEYGFLLNAVFEFFLVMAGFFLLYSLVWRRFEPERPSFSSLFNLKIIIFYIMALVVVFLDYLWTGFYFMYISQIITFFIASIISFINYRKDKNQHNFPRFYFIAMLLALIAWILNFLAGAVFFWNQAVVISVHILNMVFFLLFLFGVIKVTKIK